VPPGRLQVGEDKDSLDSKRHTLAPQDHRTAATRIRDSDVVGKSILAPWQPPQWQVRQCRHGHIRVTERSDAYSIAEVKDRRSLHL
jgi:hypothetical protein